VPPERGSGGCARCRSFCAIVPIRRPDDLIAAASRARDAVAAGTLVDAGVPETSLAPPQESIDDIARGSWSDVVEKHFRCTACGQTFTLSAETYHGSGGEWRAGP
jgi:hypothetical protein